MFTFSSCFDENGLLHYIGTEGRSSAYSNPHTRGHVKASRSSNESGNVYDFVGRDKVTSYTSSQANSWMKVDLGSTRTLVVDRYCLRYGRNNVQYMLRSWNLEGSNDDVNWSILRQHNNDTSMAETAYSEGHWDVNSAASNSPYRFFRIVQTGKDARGYDNLMCSGMELYGKLRLTAGNF